ncbi:Nudix hydrolase 3 [Zea mays]|uniref:Nudix hydrolase 3 n=1 Tax=Zea mays TaxID=4577 RepID=A0A1D6HN29_MAIZE|nr:Nudix hydrolase 3 [Zea mays]
MAAAPGAPEERLGVLTPQCLREKTGISEPRHAPVPEPNSPVSVGFLRSDRVISSLACFVFLRSEVHRDGNYHRAVNVWIYSESTGELLLQRRADCEELWPGQ